MASSHKQYTLAPYKVINQTSLSSSITSSVTDVAYKDNINYQYVWTGTLAGTFSVQTSSNYDPNFPSNATWDDVPITGAVASGSANSGTIELNNLGAFWIRTIFTRTSGTGDLTVTISGKVE